MSDAKELQTVPNESTQLAEFRNLVSRAIDSGLGVDSMERLLDMYRQQKADWAKERYYQALSEFQSRCPEIPKKKVVFGKSGKERYRYAPLDVIVATVKELLRECGFSYSIETEQSSEWVTAICRTYHADGHSESTRFAVPIDPEAYMNAQQKVASALTYAKRYAFCDALGILTTDEDDDANSANVQDDEKPQAAASSNGGKKKDPKRQQIIDDIVAVLRDPVFDDADRQHFKDTVGELKTYQELTDHLIATQQERDRRKESSDLDATAAKAFDDTDTERSQAESKLPDSEPVDAEMEEAKTDEGLF